MNSSVVALPYRFAVGQPLRTSKKAASPISVRSACSDIAPRSYTVAGCLINLADVLEARGDLTEAIRYSEECLAISRESDSLAGAEAATCGNLGNLHSRFGEPKKALDYYLTSQRISEAIGYDGTCAHALRGVGVVYRSFDRDDEAQAALSRSAALFEKLGDSVGQAASLQALGELHLDRGDYAAAVQALREGLTLAEGCEDLGLPRRRAGRVSGPVRGLRWRRARGAARRCRDQRVGTFRSRGWRP